MDTIARAARILRDTLDGYDAHLLGAKANMEDFDRLQRQIAEMHSEAEKLATDKASMRKLRGENPNLVTKGRSASESFNLSRQLIPAYASAGHSLSISPESALHRLLKLAHRAAGLDEPSFSTLRKYVSDFK